MENVADWFATDLRMSACAAAHLGPQGKGSAGSAVLSKPTTIPAVRVVGTRNRHLEMTTLSACDIALGSGDGSANVGTRPHDLPRALHRSGDDRIGARR